MVSNFLVDPPGEWCLTPSKSPQSCKQDRQRSLACYDCEETFQKTGCVKLWNQMYRDIYFSSIQRKLRGALNVELRAKLCPAPANPPLWGWCQPALHKDSRPPQWDSHITSVPLTHMRPAGKREEEVRESEKHTSNNIFIPFYSPLSRGFVPGLITSHTLSHSIMTLYLLQTRCMRNSKLPECECFVYATSPVCGVAHQALCRWKGKSSKRLSTAHTIKHSLFNNFSLFNTKVC